MVRSMLLRKIQGCASSCLKSWNGRHQLFSKLSEIRERLGEFKTGCVDLEKDDDSGIAVLTLNSPKRKNALSGKMMVELGDRVAELSEWQEGRGLIVRGANNTFCSGGDLKMVAAMLNSQSGDDMARYMHDVATRLHNLPLVSLALVQGLALGGGAELSTACDVRVMTESARVGFVQIRMGLTTAWAGSMHLVNLLGRPRSLHIMGSGKVFNAAQALDLGWCTHVIPDSPRPLDCAKLLLQKQYCNGALQLTRSVKVNVAGIQMSSCMEDALAAERKTFASVFGGDVQREALAQRIKHV